MSKFTKPKKGGIRDVIRCDEKDYLIWKWHPNKYEEGTLKRETAIRSGSVIRVKNGEVAVFFYKHNDGKTQDFIEGPTDEELSTKNLPILSSIIGLLYEGDTPFQAEVFFINIAKTVSIRFGIPYFNVVDPRYKDFEVPVAVRGSIVFSISDCKRFVNNYQLATFTLEDLNNKITHIISKTVKDSVMNSLNDSDVSVINIESRIGLISSICETKSKEKLFDVFGIDLKTFDISAIEVNQNSKSYQELKSITKDIAIKKARVDITNYEEQLRIQREEGQYAQHMATKQSNLGAYQTEVSGEVGVAGADALGKMGENGAGTVNMGGNAGFNPMTMMAGMAVGSAVGQNIAGTLNKSINSDANITPPPLPTNKYYVAIDNQPTGPYDIDTLKNMISTGKFNSNSLVWKEGMPSWQAANTIAELEGIFPPKIE